MFVQTEITPNPNSLKFLPGKSVSLIGPIEITEISKTSKYLWTSHARSLFFGSNGREHGVSMTPGNDFYLD